MNGLRIGITLNDTVRDFQNAFGDVYTHWMNSIETAKKSANELKHASTGDLSETSLNAGLDEFIINNVETEIERKLLFLAEDVDLFNMSRRYIFEDEAEYQNFLYDDFAFQIFSRCNLMYSEAMNDLNSLYNELVSGGHNVTIVSQERNNSKQATLLFLSRNKFQCNNIKFLYNYSKIWELYDLIITANPYIIASKPKGKLCMKITNELNLDMDADKEFENLFDVLNFYKKNRK